MLYLSVLGVHLDLVSFTRLLNEFREKQDVKQNSKLPSVLVPKTAVFGEFERSCVGGDTRRKRLSLATVRCARIQRLLRLTGGTADDTRGLQV